jgi:DNA-binding NarL/FixJ family response regulator
LRAACPAAVVIVLISHLDARKQAALSAGADAFISKGETPDRVAVRLRAAAESIHASGHHPVKVGSNPALFAVSSAEIS